MGARSTDRSSKGFGINKVLDGKLLEFFNTKRTGGGSNPETTFLATGGTILTPGNGYTYHVFTTSSTPGFEVLRISATVDYLVIGGGGAGGNGPDGGAYYAAGGGGAGGFRTGTTPVVVGAYPIVVGGGGASGTGPYPGATGGFGNNGSPSTVFSTTYTGGGGGGGGTNA